LGTVEEISKDLAIRPIHKYVGTKGLKLPEDPGIYAFWWIGSKADLLAGNRQIVLKGPKGVPVKVEYGDWWPSELTFPCLYVGKTTNLKRRFSLHIKNGCKDRLHTIRVDNQKGTPVTTSCQLRHGIEHVFPRDPDPLTTVLNSVGFSYSNDFVNNTAVERFYAEDRLIGAWRPWFNIDSER
jgi:hypothetical protein